MINALAGETFCVQKKVLRRYCTKKLLPSAILNGVAITTIGCSDQYETITMYTNGFHKIAGFASWEDHPFSCLFTYVHKNCTDQNQPQQETYHCHAASRNLLLYGNIEDKFIKFIDLRNGDIKMHSDVGLPIQPIQFSKPIAWSTNECVILHSSHGLRIWDLFCNRVVQIRHLPSVGNTIKAFTTIKDFNDNQIHLHNRYYFFLNLIFDIHHYSLRVLYCSTNLT